ncbi:carbohydrate sulfotransferase 1-like [Ciona intestinalis]
MPFRFRYRRSIYLLGLLTVVSVIVYNKKLHAKESWSNKSTTTNAIEKHTAPNAVILLTQRRSGSSIVGELFNQYVNVSYFYEPLFPFDDTCKQSLQNQTQKTIQHIASCELTHLPKLYNEAFNVTNRDDKYSKCKEYGVCFAGYTRSKYSAYLTRDAQICHTTEVHQQCPAPIDLDRLSSHCRSSIMVAMKVIYLCRLEWITPLLSSKQSNVKIVHLVRDPRAIVNSRIPQRDLKSEVNKARFGVIRFYAHQICDQLSSNVDYADMAVGSLVPRESYLRIRHEDFALEPIQVSEKIYKFLSLPFREDMRKWVLDATTSNTQASELKTGDQGTKRNSKEIVSAWREKLSFEEVVVIQEICKDSLNKLGYRVFNTEKELQNVQELHFEPMV